MTALANFIERFHLLMDKRKCTADTVYLRSAISSEEEAFEFTKSFSAMTGTDWVIHHSRPHSQKYIFLKTWLCHRSWNIKTESSSPVKKCCAKIDVLLKKTSPSVVKNDPYLNHNPPLCCVIRLTGKHNHNSTNVDDFQMTGLTAEVKEKFFEYFQIGLTASEASMQHEIFIQTMKNEKKILKHSSNLTSRQAQHLYNHWMNLKDTIEFSKETTDSTIKFTLDELLKAIPSKLEQVSKDPPVEINTNFFSDDNGLQTPLMFMCTDFAENSPSTDGHLLYNLKYGLQQTLVSRLTVPPISLVRIDSLKKSQGKKLLKQTTIPKIPIKLEPLDYDEETDGPTYACSGNIYDSPMTPIISKAENASSLNLYLANDISGVESCVFPLVFTSTGLTSTSKYEKDAPLLYSLKHGTHGVYVTPLSMPNILAVQIPSTNQTTLNIKSEHLNMEVTLDSHVQVEHIKREIEDTLPLNPPIVTSAESMPVILNVSSCRKRKRKISPQTYTSNGCISSETLPTKYAMIPSVKPSELKDDEDYQFLMSLLPEMKQLPQDQKSQVKKKMKDFLLTSRLCSSRIRFENSRSNIYRDCGVLPSLRDWKF